MSALEIALHYAARGWPVFPVSNAGNKVPLIAEWPTAASAQPDQIRRWRHLWPRAFVALATGKAGFVVLDIDVKQDRNGFDTLADLGKSILPETPMVFTRSGGLHVYFRANPSIEIRNSTGIAGLGLGLDVRGNGGQVVLPGAGSGYVWDRHWNFDTVAPLVAPAWLGHKTKEDRDHCANVSNGRFDPHQALQEACERIRLAADGQKHYELNNNALRVGGLVRDGFISQAEAWGDLRAATASLIAHSDADRERTWRSLENAFADGLNAPTRRRA